jgi:TetR/AcrR family transcriptional regulator
MARSRSSQASSSTPDATEVTPPRKRAKRKPAAAKLVGSEEQTPTKLRLLNAATFEFAERGFAGARIDEIARRAQLNKQLIYHYYGGKKQLYAAVLTDMVRRLQTEGAGSLAREFDSNRILEFQLRLLHVVRGPIGRQWVRLLMFEALEADGAIHLEEARRRVYEGGVLAVEVAQGRGELDPALDARMLRMVLLGLALVPSLLPQITKMVTGMDQQTPEFEDRWGRTLRDLYSRLAAEKRD